MDTFEYLSVMISIVLGLGVAQLVTGLGQTIRDRDTVRPYWLSVLWVVIMILAHIQTWWAMFGMRDYRAWSFATFFVVLLQPVVLYLQSSLLTPDPDEGPRAAYYRQSRWFHGLFIAVLAISLLKDFMLDGRLPEAANVAAHGLFFVLSAISMTTRNPRIHQALGPFVLAALLLYIGMLFAQLD